MPAPSDLFRIEWAFDPLERLAELRDARGMLDIWVEDAVREARTEYRRDVIDDVTDRQGRTETRHRQIDQPATWQAIGDALGISRAAAWERWRNLS